MKRMLIAAVAIVIAACGGNDTGPTTVDLSGSWTVSFSGMAISGTGDCAITDITVTIQETQATLSGTHGSADVTCPLIPTYTFPSGTLTGSAGSAGGTIFLDQQPDEKRLDGTLNGSTLSGNARWLQGGVVATGIFTAVRQ